MKKHFMMCYLAVLILSTSMFLGAQPSAVTSSPACMTEQALVSKRAKDVVVELMNEGGKFTGGGNRFCIKFRNSRDGRPVDVHEVSVEFSQLVGRIHERPILAQIMQESGGEYLAHVDLGRQYYNPAAYYAVVRYFDLAGKEKKTRFLLSVE
jgi:hypothetical protein